MGRVFDQETAFDVAPELDEVRRLTLSSRLEELDRDRLIQSLARARVTQAQIAVAALVSQPRVSQITRLRLAVVPEGYSGASPYEIAERYAAGLIDEETLVAELVRWPYADERPVEDVADIWSPGAGTFNDVERAFMDRLITAEQYDAVVDRLDVRQS
jgi:hypothetical protein